VLTNIAVAYEISREAVFFDRAASFPTILLRDNKAKHIPYLEFSCFYPTARCEEGMIRCSNDRATAVGDDTQNLQLSLLMYGSYTTIAAAMGEHPIAFADVSQTPIRPIRTSNRRIDIKGFHRPGGNVDDEAGDLPAPAVLQVFGHEADVPVPFERGSGGNSVKCLPQKGIVTVAKVGF
jgi:hypothetical protein